MRHLAILSGLVPLFLLIAFSAAANPGDPRALQGVLVWSAGAAGGPFVVVRGDDGRHYVADVSTAQRRGEPPNVGDRVSLVGVEGTRSWEMSALVVGLGDSALSALAPPMAAPPATAAPPAAAAPSAPAARTTPPPTPSPWRKIHGRIESISGKTLQLRDSDGRDVTVDMSQLKGNAETELQPGDDATLFVVAENDQQLVAVGFVQKDVPQPSALPRQPR